MSEKTPGADLPVRRIDRILAFMSLGLLVLSLLCFLSIIFSTMAGMKHSDYATGVWPVVSLIVYIAPIVAFLLLVIVLIMTFVRRARANKA